MTRLAPACILAVLGSGAIGAACLFPGDCGGDSCQVYTVVAGKVSDPGGAPAAGLRLESQVAMFTDGTGCDTTAMRAHFEERTDPAGEYVLPIPGGGLDEVNCAFIRLGRVPGRAWNDTLVGPLELGEFGTEQPPDTTRVDIVLQPAS